jgi:hypothetical protein
LIKFATRNAALARVAQPANNTENPWLTMRLMTLSRRKIYLVAVACVVCTQAFAAPPPDSEMAAAGAAIASAERAAPSGDAGLAMQEARSSFAQAQAFYAKRKWKDAARLAELAEANADLARARARLARARQEVDAKAARNADLRRELFVVPER